MASNDRTKEAIMRIHRLTVQVADYQIVDLPWPWKIISAAPARTGGEYLDIWFQAPNEHPRHDILIGHTELGDKIWAPVTERVQLHIAGTGHVIPNDAGDFIATCVMHSGLVWHLFARTATTNERNTP